MSVTINTSTGWSVELIFAGETYLNGMNKPDINDKDETVIRFLKDGIWFCGLWPVKYWMDRLQMPDDWILDYGADIVIPKKAFNEWAKIFGVSSWSF